jgi:DNA polymerase-3 subunit epsilon
MNRSMHLKLKRPLAVFDIESTGTNWRVDRIIDLAIVKIHPDGRQEARTWRVHPEMAIPSSATAIHKISNADVHGCPLFKDVAAQVVQFLHDCDLGGFNVLRFDIPLLQEEFKRTGQPFSLDGRNVVDAQRIFHRKEPRDLSAALAFYCGELHLEAHQALDDVQATVRVLDGELAKYADLPRTVPELSEYCNPRDPDDVDRAGKLKWADGDVVIGFGKNAGKKLKDLLTYDTGFLKWMLQNDFPEDTKEILRKAMNGVLPQPPAAAAAPAESDE